MAILVTGGGGFVGLNLCAHLLGVGASVVLFDRWLPGEDVLGSLVRRESGLAVMTGDIESESDVERLFHTYDIDRVFHGAAITSGPRRDQDDAERVVAVNVLGTLRVLRHAARSGARRFVYPSSLSVYGESLHRDDRMVEDKTPTVPESLYAITKYSSERAVKYLGRLWGIDTVSARIGSAFGPWERDTGVRDQVSPYAQLAALAVRGQDAVLPGHYPKREQIYSRDLASALGCLLLGDDHAHDVYNVSAPFDWNGTLDRWGQRLSTAFRGFSCRVAEGSSGNVSFHDDRPRGSLGASRLRDDFGWTPAFPPEVALDDYLDWMISNQGYFL